MNSQKFYAALRAAVGPLSQGQVDGINAILAAWGDADTRYTAYGLATVWLETGETMQPIRERGGTAYLSKYDTGRLAAALGNTPAADGDGVLYCGRGFVQLTGRQNYARAGKALGIDLIARPDLAMVPAHAAAIMVRGMQEGWFTGKKLADYFGPDRNDPVNARRIINGTDKAATIAKHYQTFKFALECGRAGEGKNPPQNIPGNIPAPSVPPPPDIEPPPLTPVNAPSAQPASRGLFRGLVDVLAVLFAKKGSW